MPTRRLATKRLARKLPKQDLVEAFTSSALQRVNFFSGQLLTAENLQAEQDYFRARLRRLNLAAFGAGVVSGLKVTIGDDGDSVQVAPGFAVDPRGEELILAKPVIASLPTGDARIDVYLRFCERLTHPTPGVESQAVNYARVDETVEVIVAATATAPAVLIAQLRRQRKGWRLVKTSRRR